MPDNVLIATTDDSIGAQHQKIINEYLDNTGAPVAVTAATPLPVAATISTAGLATSANQGTEITALDQIHTDLTGTIEIAGAVAVSNFPATQPVSAASLPLPTGAATSGNQATEIAAIDQLHTDLTSPLPAGTNNIGAVSISGTVALPTNAAQETGGNLAAIKADTDKIPAQGQALAAASMPVVLTAIQQAALTPPAAITNFAEETGGNLAAIKSDVDKIPSQGQALAAASMPVVLTAIQQAALTPPAAITNYAEETGGNLAAIKLDVDKIPSQGQALAAASMPVVLTAIQQAALTPPAAITNFAEETGGNLAAIKADVDKIPSQGAAATAASTPVNIASDQVVPVSLNVPTTINNGKTAVSTSGTRVTLAASTVVKSVTIKALITNTGLIYVGNATVASTNGYQLAAGDSISLDIANLNTVNLDCDNSGEGVSYISIT